MQIYYYFLNLQIKLRFFFENMYKPMATTYHEQSPLLLMIFAFKS